MSDNDPYELVEKLYVKHSVELYYAALLKLNNQEEAKEAMQEAFTIAFIKRDVLMAHPNKIGWLYKILYNCVQRQVFKNSYRTRKKNDADITVTSMTKTSHVEFSEKNEDMLCYEEKFLEDNPFEKYKDILTEKEIQLLIYKFEEDLSVKEISEKLNTTYTNTTTMTSAIYKKIKNFIKSD